MNKSQLWHKDEQERIAKQMFRKFNGGPMVGEVLEWGRKKKRLKKEVWPKVW